MTKAANSSKKKLSIWRAGAGCGVLVGSLLAPGFASAADEAPDTPGADQFITDERGVKWSPEEVRAKLLAGENFTDEDGDRWQLLGDDDEGDLDDDDRHEGNLDEGDRDDDDRDNDDLDDPVPQDDGDTQGNDAVVLHGILSEDLERSFVRWSGEAHASTLSALSNQSVRMRDTMLGRARAMDAGRGAGASSTQSQSVVHGDSGKAIWAQYTGTRDRWSKNGKVAGLDATSSGVLFGGDMPWPGSADGGARLGLMAGFTSGNIDVNDRNTKSTVDSYTLGAYGGAPLGTASIAGSDGPARLRYGASYTWHSVSARRNMAYWGTAQSRYRAGTAQVFTEAGLPYKFGGTTVEPYVGLAYVDTHRRAFNESGSVANLHADAAKQRLGYSTLGLRADTGWDLKDGSRLALYGSAGWLHAYGDVTPTARMRLDQGENVNVQGVPVARDAMLVEAGASVSSGRGMMFGLGYSGQLAHGAQSNAFKANLAWRF